MSRAVDQAAPDSAAHVPADSEVGDGEADGAATPPVNEPASKLLVGAPALPDWVPAQLAPAFDLRAPDLYLNRELTWLQFNYRVLHEAEDPRTLLLERVKFLAIAASNMDEFVMKRVGGLKQQIGAGLQKMTVDGRTPEQQLSEIRSVVGEFLCQQRKVYLELIAHLRDSGIEVLRFEELASAEKAGVREHYCQNVFPLVTPLAMDPSHPFPFLSNLSLNLLVTLRFPDEPELTMARIKVPVGSGVGRFIKVGDTGRRYESLSGRHVPWNACRVGGSFSGDPQRQYGTGRRTGG